MTNPTQPETVLTRSMFVEQLNSLGWPEGNHKCMANILAHDAALRQRVEALGGDYAAASHLAEATSQDWQRCKAQLAAVTKELPDTFYADRPLSERVALIVHGWRKTVESSKQVDDLQAKFQAVEGALKASDMALTDWLHTYARELCEVEHYNESRGRINEHGGTLAYIGELRQRNKAALQGKGEGHE